MEQPGRRSNDPSVTEKEFLQQYDPTRYDRPSVTVDAVIFTVTDEVPDDIRKVPDKVLRVLLVQRSSHPFRDHWALPGGFVRIDESLDDAVIRVLHRETGLDQIYLEQLYTWGAVERDPRTRVISVSYMALVDASALRLQPGMGTADARWFTVPGETAQLDLAFDHAAIIQYALKRLRSKLEWTDIAFHLVPERFTLKELQKVYETILGREITDMQFRRNVDRMVEPTNEMRANVGHRPARLFRFRPDWAEK